VSAAVASIQVSSASPIPTDQPMDISKQEHLYTKKPPSNILKQAWLNCQTLETPEINKAADTASSSEVASSTELHGNRVKSKRPRVKPGLPKPTMYKGSKEKKETKITGSKRRKLQQKVRELACDSSEDEDDGSKFISELEKEMFSAPYDSGLDSAVMNDILNTSTPGPSKRKPPANLPSPIHVFTPVRESTVFDGSFLDSLSSSRKKELSLEYTEMKDTSCHTPKLGGSPNSSFLDFGQLPFVSPDKLHELSDHGGNISSHNLSRILSECGLDPNDNPEQNFPNLNWSVVEQMMDTS